MKKRTRDSQNKRLTTTRYIEVADCLPEIFNMFEEYGSDESDLNEHDVLILKILVFHIWIGDECFIPITHWKLIKEQLFQDAGGYESFRLRSPRLAEALLRPDRTRRSGRELKGSFRARFRRRRGDG